MRQQQQPNICRQQPNRTRILVVLALALGLFATAEGQDSMFVDATGNVGVGTNTPERQLHLRGENAVFRMDRDRGTSAFLLTRWNPGFGTNQKTFVVGTNASGSNDGSFVINDLGTDLTGGGTRRMTITNSGDVEFTGTVFAEEFVSTSSASLKRNIRTINNASTTIQDLRGVRFDWKESGKPSIGLIAEEVAEVIPSIVHSDASTGKPSAINYTALTAVLIQAFREQEEKIQSQRDALKKSQSTLLEQQEQINQLQDRLTKLESANGE